MLDYLSLENALGAVVPLHGGDGRAVAQVDGLVGVAAPREITRPRPQGHGSLNDTRWLGDRLIVVQGECWGSTHAEALDRFDALAAAAYDTLSAPRLLKWQRAGGGPALQAAVKLAGDLKPPVGGVGRFLRYQLQLRAEDPRAFGQAEVVVPGSAVAPSTQTNLVTNPSFEVNTTGWTTAGGVALTSGATLTRNNVTNAPDGNFAGFVNCPGGAVSEGVSTTVPLEAGKTYRVRISVNRDAGGATLAMGLRKNPAGGAGAVLLTQNMAPGSGTYTEYTGLFTADATANYDLFVRTEQAQATLFRVDAALVVEGDAPYFAGTRTTSGGGRFYPLTYPYNYAPISGGVATTFVGGSVPTLPALTVYGQCVNPQVQLDSTGERIVIAGEIGPSDTLEIDLAKPTSQRVLLNGAASRLSLVDFEQTTWWELPPGEQTVSLLASSFDSNARVDVRYRPAYL